MNNTNTTKPNEEQFLAQLEYYTQALLDPKKDNRIEDDELRTYMAVLLSYKVNQLYADGIPVDETEPEFIEEIALARHAWGMLDSEFNAILDVADEKQLVKKD